MIDHDANNDNNEKNRMKLKKIVLFLTDGECCDDKEAFFESLINFKENYGQEILHWWNVGLGEKADKETL